MRFNDLSAAGRALAPALDKYRDDAAIVVVGLAFGGVPVALEVARHLGKPLDVLFIRRLILTAETDSAAAAINVCGKLLLEDALNFREAKSPQDRFVITELEDLDRTVHACRRGRPLRDLRGTKVLLVDNGVRTGATINAAVKAVRNLGASQVVVAVPVAAQQTRSMIQRVADHLICLEFIDPFGHVGMFYQKFVRPSETDIAAMLNAADLSIP